SVIVPSCRLTSVVDGECDGVKCAGRLDRAEAPIDSDHGMSKALRVLRKPTDISLLIDSIKPCSQGARKADVSEDAVLPDKSVRRGGSFRRNAGDSDCLPPVVHLDDGGARRTGIVNGRENVADHDKTVP